MAGLDPVSNVASAAAEIIGLFKANPTVKAQLSQQLDETALSGQIQEVLAEIQVDAVEAASKSTFVAGWRPGIGWVCGAAMAYAYIVQPLGGFLLAAVGHPVALPAVSLSELMPVLLGMLGLGAMRTVEKVQGVAGNSAH